MFVLIFKFGTQTEIATFARLQAAFENQELAELLKRQLQTGSQSSVMKGGYMMPDYRAFKRCRATGASRRSSKAADPRSSSASLGRTEPPLAVPGGLRPAAACACACDVAQNQEKAPGPGPNLVLGPQARSGPGGIRNVMCIRILGLKHFYLNCECQWPNAVMRTS